MKQFYYLVSVLFLISNQITSAQVETNYFPEKNGKERINMMPTNFKASKSLNLPPFDLEAMLEEDKRSSDMTGPFRFGKGFDVNIELDKTEFKEVAGGRVWAMDFESRGAKSINFVFKEFYLSKGAQLFVYNETGTVVYGPVTHLNNPKNGFFLTDLILGDKVTLYLYEPNNSDE